MSADNLRKQAGEIIKQARADLEGISEKATADETKSIQDKVEAMLDEANQLKERAKQLERLEAFEAEDQIRQEAKNVKVESGGDLSHRKLDPHDERSYAEERYKPPTQYERERRDELWKKFHLGDKLSDEENMLRQKDFPEDLIYRVWMRHGENYKSHLPEPLQRADITAYPITGDFGNAATTKLADVGKLLPKKMADEITWKMLYYGSMLELGNTIRTSDGNKIHFPVMDSTDKKAKIVGEGIHPGVGKIAASEVTIPVYEYATEIMPVSYSSIMDSEYDLEGVIRNWMAEQFGRALNEHFTTGTGNTQPGGLLTRAAVAARTATSTTAGTDGNTDVELVDLLNMQYLIDKAYRMPSNVYQMNDKLCAKLLAKTYGSGDGRFLWGNLMGGQPMSIWGHRVVVNNDISLAKNKAAVVFGDHSKYFIRIVRDITMGRSEELGMPQRVVLFGNWMRAGGDTVLTEPFSILNTKNA